MNAKHTLGRRTMLPLAALAVLIAWLVAPVSHGQESMAFVVDIR